MRTRFAAISLLVLAAVNVLLYLLVNPSHHHKAATPTSVLSDALFEDNIQGRVLAASTIPPGTAKQGVSQPPIAADSGLDFELMSDFSAPTHPPCWLSWDELKAKQLLDKQTGYTSANTCRQHYVSGLLPISVVRDTVNELRNRSLHLAANRWAHVKRYECENVVDGEGTNSCDLAALYHDAFAVSTPIVPAASTGAKPPAGSPDFATKERDRATRTSALRRSDASSSSSSEGVAPFDAAEATESRCISGPPSNRWRPAEYRVAMELDRRDALEAQETKNKNTKKNTNNNEDDDASMRNASEPGILRWMRKSRWAFDVFRPFADESSCSRPPISGSSSGDSDSFASRRLVKNSKAGAKASDGSVHVLENVCISSSGGGLTGHFSGAAAQQKAFVVNTVVDEVGYDVRGEIYVLNRNLQANNNNATRRPHHPQPPCFLNRTVVLLHSLTHSENLGHSMFRTLQLSETLRLASRLDDKEPIVGYVVTQRSGKSMDLGSGHRFWYPFATATDSTSTTKKGNEKSTAVPLWFSVLQPGNFNAMPIDRLVQGAPEDDLCFRRVVVGWKAIRMWDRGRNGVISVAERQQRHFVNPIAVRAAQQVRDAATRCLLGPDQGERSISSSDVPWHTQTSSPNITIHPMKRQLRVTLIRRTTRLISNEKTLITALRQKLPRGTTIAVVDFDGMPSRQQVAVAASTDILLGAHGTSMQLALWMKPHSVLGEIRWRGLGCGAEGVNEPRRGICEFGKACIASQVSQVVTAVPQSQLQCDCEAPCLDRCNVTLTEAHARWFADTLLCAKLSGYEAAFAKCDRRYQIEGKP